MGSSITLQLPLLTASAEARARVPRVRAMRQRLETRRVDDIAGAIAGELARPAIGEQIARGHRIAIGVGSRGIDRCPDVVAALVRELRRRGAEPFVIAAMGSHGGATADGKRALLAGLGFTEAAIGAPVRVETATVELGRLDDGTPIYIDALAAAADGIVVVNRIKPHTAFRAPIESGLAKMLAVGLGHADSAAALHRHGMARFDVLVPAALALIRTRAPVRFGIALVENGRGELAHVEAVAADAIASREVALLELARAYMPTLPFAELDVLVLERLGKDISGQGADPNVVGRSARGLPFGGPRIDKLVGLDLSDGAHGNALGIGQLDVVTAQLVARADLAATYANVVPTTYLDLGALPLVAATPSDAVTVAVGAIAGRAPRDVRLVYARDTKSLATLFVSEALFDEVRAHDRCELVGEPRPLLDGDNLVSWSVDIF
ncbi:MAG TPA: lactate racemase domain-containing protein [Kofleriaceae bacterium]|nr:lactate racemase domain-containing protein [Kofleriaceae bacterium]